MALGAFEVTPWDLIQSYTAFANGGYKVDLTGVHSVINAKGQTIYQSRIVKTPVIHKETAYLITNMLQSVVTSGTAASLRSYGLTQPIAGKTGTSNDYRDAWFVGYTPDLLCLVWVGYDDNKPLRLTGAQAAIPIWAHFMKKALAKIPVRDFAKPGNTIEREIDPTTGKLAGWDCIYRAREVFIKGTEPIESCTDEDHYRSPEAFLGPRSRSAPLMIQKTGETTDSYTYKEGDYTYNEDEISPSDDPNSENESNDGYFYIAAPVKNNVDSQKSENHEGESSQQPSDTQQFQNLETLSDPDTERPPDSEQFEAYQQPTLDQFENQESDEQIQNDYDKIERSTDPNQEEGSKPLNNEDKKKQLRPPKNIDEPQTQPEQN